LQLINQLRYSLDQQLNSKLSCVNTLFGTGQYSLLQGELKEKIESFFLPSNDFIFIQNLLFMISLDIKRLSLKSHSKNASLEALPHDLYIKFHSCINTKSTSNDINIIYNNAHLQVNSKFNRLSGMNILLALNRRQIDTKMNKCSIVQPEFYSSVNIHKRILGHLSAVYCVCFDRTGRYILTVCLTS
jgi:hypothetical protein